MVCASEAIVGRLVLMKRGSDLNSPAINQRVMLHLARTSFDRQVRKTCLSYKAKRDLMLSLLPGCLPDGSTWTRPEGGMFIWATVPEGIDTAELLETAVRRHGVAYVPGHAFFAGGGGRNTLRLSYSLPSLEDIRTGVARLGELFSHQ